MKFAIAKSAKNASDRTPISWTLRLFTLLVWLLVGLCAAYWAFKFVTTKPVEAATVLAAPTVMVDSKTVGKLLGATDKVAAKVVNIKASTKFVLFGVANSAGGQGYALIALDGKPAKPYRVGSMVADDLLLKSISKTGVMLATSLKAPDGVTLELPVSKSTYVAPTLTVSGIARSSATPVFNAMAPVAVPQVAPSFVPPAVPSVLSAIERPIASSRFAPPMGANISPGNMPAAATSSAVAER